MRPQAVFYNVFVFILHCLLSAYHGSSFTCRTIVTKLCDKFCLNRDKNCVVFSTPVGECYNGQFLFPNDPSWGEYDIRDTIVDSNSFVRTFYVSVDESCQNSTDTYTLPFNECVGPFGPPYPWGKFSLLNIDNEMNLGNSLW